MNELIKIMSGETVEETTDEIENEKRPITVLCILSFVPV